jgi:hypothetical protein
MLLLDGLKRWDLVYHLAGEAININSNPLFRRETDRFIRRNIGKQSLAVGADNDYLCMKTLPRE